MELWDCFASHSHGMFLILKYYIIAAALWFKLKPQWNSRRGFDACVKVNIVAHPATQEALLIGWTSHLRGDVGWPHLGRRRRSSTCCRRWWRWWWRARGKKDSFPAKRERGGGGYTQRVKSIYRSKEENSHWNLAAVYLWHKWAHSTHHYVAHLHRSIKVKRKKNRNRKSTEWLHLYHWDKCWCESAA